MSATGGMGIDDAEVDFDNDEIETEGLAEGGDSSLEEKAPSTPAATNRTIELWRSRLVRKGKGGALKTTLANALIPLRHAREWQGVLRYNAFNHAIELHRAPPWEQDGKSASAGFTLKPSTDANGAAQAKEPAWPIRAWSDYDDMRLTEWLQKEKLDVTTRIAGDAAFVVAKENLYHPVRDYLDTLAWDGVPRVDRWLSTYLGAEESPYHEAIGVRWLISGIARIRTPGDNCKADAVLILEGEQGLQKSTALKILSSPWFLDDLRQFGSKEAAMKIAGRWVIEIAELTAMGETSVEACKGFFSQTMDSFRPPYGKRVIDAPRQCIFAASTNKNMFLKDETGDRRYWPVACTKIDIEALRRDRDQLWAEAQERFRDGQPWWLETPELRALAEEEQRARFEADPWENAVRGFLRNKAETTPEQVLLESFEFPIDEISKILRNRVSAILRHLKWVRVRVRVKPHLGTRKGRDEYVWVRRPDTVD